MAGQGGGLGDIETQDQFEERFWSKVQFPENRLSECWNWAAARNRGYGVFSIKGSTRRVLAHRVSHELVNGFLDDGEVVMHSCDNPSCVSPFHLKKGTQKQNQRDMAVKGRHGMAKLTANNILEIFRMASEGVTQVLIAETFGVDHSNVSKILKGKHWVHVARKEA